MTSVKPGTEVSCTIESAAFEGKSIARVEGLVVFVEGAVPGDEALIRITRKKKNHAEAVLVSVIKPSPHRVDPRCSHFGTCGGCRWQHVSYDEQLRFKTQHVVDSFERLGGIKGFELRPILGCKEPFWYRNKMEFSFAERQWTREKPTEGEEPAGIFLGLHAPQRFDKVLDIQTCYLESEESNSILKKTRDFARSSGLPVYNSNADAGFWRFLVIRQSKRSNEILVNIVTREDSPDVMLAYADALRQSEPGVTTIVNTVNATKSQIAFGDLEKVYLGPGRMTERLGRFAFEVSAQSFFQTNTEQTERLYNAAIDLADVRKDDVVFDLYAGTGTISLFLSDKAREVIAIESFERAVIDARKNAEQNGVSNCIFLHGDMKNALRNLGDESLKRPRIVLVDPPRSGMHEKAVKDVADLQPERIIYISCNPATQARDCKLFATLGYSTIVLQPVDMFPQTYHVENIALLQRIQT